MGKNFTIDDFHEHNAKEAYALVRDVYQSSAFMSDDFDRKFPDDDTFHKHYFGILKQAGSFFLIAKIDDRPVGYVCVEANPALRLCHTSSLNMGIVENYRGRGLGRKLLDAAIRRADTEKIIEIIYLMVREDHAGAIKLYESSGFEKLAFLEKDTRIGNEYFTGILMRKFIL